MSEVHIHLEPPPEPPVTEAEAGNKRKAPASEADKPQKARKKYAKRAACWEHFLQRDGNLSKSYCKYCGAEIACDSKTVGISPMIGHLKICKQYKDWDEKEKQQVLTGDNKGNLKVIKYDPHLFRKSVNEMVVVNELPFSFVESEGWKRFCFNLFPMYKTITRKTCSKDIVGVDDDGGNELQRYLADNLEARVENRLGMPFDVLSWWRCKSSNFPVLAEFAKDVLASQASFVASESAFSTSGRVLDPYRSSLTPFMVEVLICTQQWLRCSFKSEADIANLAQMLEEVEFFESLDSRNALPPPP